MPLQTHSFTDVHTLLGNRQKPSWDGYPLASEIILCTALSISFVVTDGWYRIKFNKKNTTVASCEIEETRPFYSIKPHMFSSGQMCKIHASVEFTQFDRSFLCFFFLVRATFLELPKLNIWRQGWGEGWGGGGVGWGGGIILSTWG